MVKRIYNEMKKKMGTTVEIFSRDLGRIRTGRASLSLLDSINVDYYGSPTPLNQLATLNVPESRLITIQPWDTSVITDVEKAIQKSDLGLTPSNDGKTIRISIPVLTEERRKDLAKLVRKNAEDSKIAIRNIRREFKDTLKNMEKNKEITEDDLFKAQDQLQKITDDYIKEIDSITKNKEQEILSN